MYTQATISLSWFSDNVGPGAVCIRTKTAVSLQWLSFSRNRNELNGDSPSLNIAMQGQSEVTVSDSEFVENTALSGAAVLAVATKKLTLIRIAVLRNYAKASCGGVLFSPNPGYPSDLTITDSIFTGNKADSFGAIALIDLEGVLMGNRVAITDLQVDGCSFQDNATNSQGSSITLYKFIQISMKSQVRNSVFTNNKSNRGPGVYCEYETGIITVSSCYFSLNTSSKGSAILAHQYPTMDVTSLMIVEDCTFYLNTGSAAVAIDGWELPTAVDARRNLYLSNKGGGVQSSVGIFKDTGSSYTANTMKTSAAVKLVRSTATLENCTWEGNVGRLNGGAFFISDRSYLEVRSSLISNNSAATLGGCLYSDESSTAFFYSSQIRSNFAGSQGSFAYTLASSLTISSCELTENRADSSFLLVVAEGKAAVTDCRIRNNTAGTNSGISASFSSMIVTNTTFEDQRSIQGGFISSGKESNVTVVSSKFSRGQAIVQGGAIYCVMGCVLAVRNSLFENCTSGNEGGAVFLMNSNATFRNVTFRSVMTGMDGGAVNWHGGQGDVRRTVFNDTVGAALVGMEVERMMIQDSRFIRGRSSHGGLLKCSSCAYLHVNASTFSDGYSETGGALSISNSLPGSLDCLLSYNSIERNNAKVGGGLSLDSVDCRLTQNRISNNSASESGGGVSLTCEYVDSCEFSVIGNSFEGNTALVSGGAVNWLGATTPVFSNNSFMNNTAYYGNDIASKAVRVGAMPGRSLAGVGLTGVASGHTYDGEILLGLFDDLGTLVTTADGYIAELVPGDGSELIFGGDIKAASSQGLLRIRNFIAIATPGSTQTAYIQVSNLADLPVTLSFRLCQVGESLNEAQCLPCPAQTYSLDPRKPCFMCPDEAFCYGNSSMVPKAGYWRYSNATDTFFECFNTDACTGSRSSPPLSLTGDCAPGYEGNLCHTCSHGYSRNGKNSCSVCPNKNSNVALTVLLAVTLLAALGLLVHVTISNATKPKSLTAVHLKILINYVQLVVIVASINIKWPSTIKTLLIGQEKAGSAAEQLSSYICLASEMGYTGASVFLTSKLTALLPACLLTLTSLFWLLLSRCKHILFLKEKVLCSWILSVFSLHPTLTKEMLSQFACKELAPGRLWLMSDMSVACWESTHMKELLTVAAPSLIIWVLGLPLFALIWLIISRRKLALGQTTLLMGFLYRGYEEKAFYWEFVIIVRKIIAISMVVSLSTQPVQIQSLSILACLLFFFYLHVYKQPFFQASLNSLESKSIFVSIITIYAGLYFSSQNLVLLMANAYFLLTWLRAAGPNLIQTLRDTCACIWRKSKFYQLRRDMSPVIIEADDEISRIEAISLSISPPNVSKVDPASFSSP